MNSKILTNNYTITETQARQDDYVGAMAEEVEIGQRASVADLQVGRIEHPVIVEYKARRAGSAAHCTKHEEWLDSLMTRFGPRRLGLSLGAGLGRIERHLVRRGLCQEFETLDVSFGRADANPAAPVGVSSQLMDLNFAKLGAEKYDFILCHGVLHHLVNLEYVLDQVNVALTQEGVVLIYEYIGDRQWQFPKETFEMLQRRFSEVAFKPVPRWAVPGFESIRSDELRDLIESVFGTSVLFSSFFGGVYFPFLTCTNGQHDDLLHQVVEYDKHASESEGVRPCYHVGVYGKSNATAPRAKPWTDEVLSQRLRRNLPPEQKIAEALRRSPLGPALRMVKRTLVGR